MTSREIRERFDEALEVLGVEPSRGKTLLQKLVTQLRDERNTLKQKWDEANARTSHLEQEASSGRSRLQDAQIELESLAQQVVNTKAALQRATTEVATLTDTLNKGPFIDAADIRVEVVDAFVNSPSITSESLNDSLKQNLIETAFGMGHVELAKWVSQLDNERINRLLHFAYSELAFLEGATGRINIVDIEIRPKASEIPLTNDSVSLIRESGGHRKGAVRAVSELISRGLLTFANGRVCRPSEVKRLQSEKH